MVTRIADILVEKRLHLFILGMVLVGVSLIGFKNFKYLANYEMFFKPDDPYLTAFQNLQETFTRSDNVAFVLVPKDKNVFTKQGIDAVLWLTRESWKLPYSVRVDSLSNFPVTKATEDELQTNDLVADAFSGEEQEIARIKADAYGEPQIVNRILSSDGSATLVVTSVQVPGDQSVALPTLMESADGVNALVDRFKEEFPEVDIYVTGVSVANYYFVNVAVKDIAKLMPGLMLVILFFIGYMTKSFSNTLVTFIIINLSVVTTIGYVFLIGVPLNNVSSIAPMVIMTLAVAESVHLLSCYTLELREGKSKVEAMKLSLSKNMKATFLTSFTTAIGFLGMNSIDSPPFVEFGYIASVGIIICYVFALILLPQLAIWFSNVPDKIVVEEKVSVVSKLAEWVIGNPKKVFYGTLLTSGGLAGCMFLNDLNDDYIGYFGKKVPVRHATEIAEAHNIGMSFISYGLESGAAYGITDLEYLKKVEAFVQWYRKQPEVIHVHALTDVLKRINQNMNGGDSQYYVLPQSREAASQFLLLYELSLPVGMDVNNLVNSSKSSLKVTVTTKMMKAKQNLALEDRAQEWLRQNAADIRVPGASPTIMYAHMGQSNVRSVMVGSFTSIGIICICMILGFGSVRLGLLALFPNVFPAAVTLGVWGIVVGEVNMGVAVIFTITSGIVVDDTIHLFTKISDGFKKGLSIDDCIRYSFQQAGASILITTVVLCAGFSVLVFSDFVINATLGIMIASTIAVAMVFDFMFMPSVLKVFLADSSFVRGKQTNASVASTTQLDVGS